MKTNLYGVKRIWLAEDVSFNFFPVQNCQDKDCVVADADWKEIKIVTPGSIVYDFHTENNVRVCKVALKAQINTDIDLNVHPLFYKVEDHCGNYLLVGLGKKYHTVPSTDVSDGLGATPDEGNKCELNVSWNCMCGRVYTRI